MDFKQIESFVRVAEMGGFTKAAQVLNTPQPLLSRHVRLLEVELRQTLLVRNGRGVSLTEAGAQMLEHGRGILHQVALAQEVLSNAGSSLAGQVSIGLPPSLSKVITVPLVRMLKQQIPNAQLLLTEGFSLQMYEGLRSGRLDMVVMYNPAQMTEFESSLLREDDLILVAKADSELGDYTDAFAKSSSSVPTRDGVARNRGSSPLPKQVSLQRVAQLDLILPSRPNAFRILIETQMQKLGLSPRIVMEVDGLSAILDLVREGMGYAILPSYTLEGYSQPLPFTTHQIVSPKLTSQLTLVWSGKRQLTQTHKTALTALQTVVQEKFANP